jgi:hypothetical protein
MNLEVSEGASFADHTRWYTLNALSRGIGSQAVDMSEIRLRHSELNVIRSPYFQITMAL